MHDHTAIYAENLSQTGRSLPTAVKGYEFAGLGAQGAKKIVPLAPVDSVVRDRLRKA